MTIKLRRQTLRKITVCYINITSITKHVDELLTKFSTCEKNSVNENNLKRERALSFKVCNIFRNDRVGKSVDGVLFVVKDLVKYSEIINESIGDNEIVTVKLYTKPISKTSISASLYVSSKAKICPKIFHKLYKLSNSCLIVDDLSAAL